MQIPIDALTTVPRQPSRALPTVGFVRERDGESVDRAATLVIAAPMFGKWAC